MRSWSGVLFAVWLIAAPAIWAQDTEVFQKANQAYKAGDYAGALKGYRELAKHIASPHLYLDLGNAAYKSGQSGWAMVYYERGLKLDPRNADLEANLKFAREHIVDRAGDDRTWLGQTIAGVYHYLSLRELLILTSIFWFLTLGVAAWLCWLDVPLWRAAVALFSVFDDQKESKMPALFLPCAAVLVFFGGWAATRLQDDTVVRGIVLEKEVKATSGPGADPTVVFAVHEGTTVTVIRRSDRWAQVVLGNGYSGWVPEESIGEF